MDEDQGDILKETGDYTEYVNCDCPLSTSVLMCQATEVRLGWVVQWLVS